MFAGISRLTENLTGRDRMSGTAGQVARTAVGKSKYPARHSTGAECWQFEQHKLAMIGNLFAAAFSNTPATKSPSMLGLFYSVSNGSSKRERQGFSNAHTSNTSQAHLPPGQIGRDRCEPLFLIIAIKNLTNNESWSAAQSHCPA